MNRSLSFALTLGILTFGLVPARAAVASSRKLSSGAQFTVDGGTLRIQFWTPETVRVTYAASNEIPALESLSVIAKP
jgi:hypothetical protein